LNLKLESVFLIALKKSVGFFNFITHNMDIDDQGYQEVNSPAHYNGYSVEVIDMMERIFGPEKLSAFCELNAFKYLMRAGKKGYAATDLAKEEWYLDKLKELKK
jgi:hypothetical protein